MQEDIIKVGVEQLAYSVKKNPANDFNNETKFKLKFLLKKFIDDSTHETNPPQNAWSQLFKNALINLCIFDKENGVAILNTSNYLKRLDKIVND